MCSNKKELLGPHLRVLDGGALLHIHHWKIKSIFSMIFHQCLGFIKHSTYNVKTVKISVELFSFLLTMLVGDDTNLLVLLSFHANYDSNQIYYSTEAKQGGISVS